MTRKKSTGSRSGGRSSTPPPTPSGPTWDEIVINRLLPWRIELGGWVLFVIAMLTLFGMAGLINPGNLLNSWFQLWRHLAGWGAYAFWLSLAAVGLYVALRRLNLPARPRMMQLVGLELMLFAALPLSYHWGGGTLQLANQGRRGGLVGWALAQPGLDFFGPLLTDLFYLALFGYGLALVRRFSWEDGVALLRATAARLRTWAAELDRPAARPEGLPEAPAAPAGVPAPVINARRGGRDSGLAPAALADRLSIVGEEGLVANETGRRDPRLPPFDLLTPGGISTMSKEEIDQKKAIIEQTLVDFGLVGTVTEVRRGPAVTQFGVQPGYLERPGPDGEPRYFKVRVNQIANLNRDLALALKVPRLRIQAPVPGRGIVGVEVPNANTAIVRLHSLITSPEFQKLTVPLGVCLGLDVSGAPQVTDLARMPHLLVAGTTGSGKSVFINALVSCLICNNTPEQLRLVMIDPKKVELIRFNGLPHLLGSVEVEQERVIGVLQWLVSEMDRRYKQFAEVGARDLTAYNRAIHRYKYSESAPYRHFHRRIGRPDGRLPGRSRTGALPSGPDGACHRHSPDRGHAAPLHRRHHRPDQGQLSGPRLLLRRLQHRLARHPRHDRR